MVSGDNRFLFKVNFNWYNSFLKRLDKDTKYIEGEENDTVKLIKNMFDKMTPRKTGNQWTFVNC